MAKKKARKTQVHRLPLAENLGEALAHLQIVRNYANTRGKEFGSIVAALQRMNARMVVADIAEGKRAEREIGKKARRAETKKRLEKKIAEYQKCLAQL